jgi:hypothetical protein
MHGKNRMTETEYMTMNTCAVPQGSLLIMRRKRVAVLPSRCVYVMVQSARKVRSSTILPGPNPPRQEGFDWEAPSEEAVIRRLRDYSPRKAAMPHTVIKPVL